jgi:hypothetical protein
MTPQEFFAASGYFAVRQLPDGRWIGLQRFLFTFGLCVDLNERHGGYETRFCYEIEYAEDAVDAVMKWDGTGDPPGRWLKQKGGIERMNPHHPNFENIPIVSESK